MVSGVHFNAEKSIITKGIELLLVCLRNKMHSPNVPNWILEWWDSFVLTTLVLEL